MSEWQPIETAPKDGTCILLADNYDSFPGYWEAEPNHWDETGWQEEDARQGHYFHRRSIQGLTHWQPLPQPPKEE